MKRLRQTQKWLEGSACVTNQAHHGSGRGKKEKTPFPPREIAKTHDQQKEEARPNRTFTKSSGIVHN